MTMKNANDTDALRGQGQSNPDWLWVLRVRAPAAALQDRASGASQSPGGGTLTTSSQICHVFEPGLVCPACQVSGLRLRVL